MAQLDERSWPSHMPSAAPQQRQPWPPDLSAIYPTAKTPAEARIGASTLACAHWWGAVLPAAAAAATVGAAATAAAATAAAATAAAAPAAAATAAAAAAV